MDPIAVIREIGGGLAAVVIVAAAAPITVAQVQASLVRAT